MKQTKLKDFKQFKAIIEQYLREIEKYHTYLLELKANKGCYRQTTLKNALNKKGAKK